MSLFDMMGSCSDPECPVCSGNEAEAGPIVRDVAASLPGLSFEEGLPGAIFVIVSLLSRYGNEIDSLKAEVEKLKVQLSQKD